jgi:hypothetical protein
MAARIFARSEISDRGNGWNFAGGHDQAGKKAYDIMKAIHRETRGAEWII